MTRNRVTPPCVVPRSAPFIRSVETLPVDTLVSAEKDSKVQTNLIVSCPLTFLRAVPLTDHDNQNDYFVFDAVSLFQPYAFKM